MLAAHRLKTSRVSKFKRLYRELSNFNAKKNHLFVFFSLKWNGRATTRRHQKVKVETYVVSDGFHHTSRSVDFKCKIKKKTNFLFFLKKK